MVKRVFQMVYKEVRGLHQAAYVLGSFAFLSQILALVRDRLLAHQFGAGSELDMYYAAFRIPDLLYVLFASTLSVYVLIPFVASRITDDDASEARKLLSQIFSSFLIVYSVLALCVFIAAPLLVPVVFPGFTGQTHTLVTIMRILLLQPLLLGISSLFGVVTQLGHRFVLYAISPLIYNIGIIGGIVFLYPLYGLNGLGYGVVIGALGHMLIQVPFLRNSSLSFSVTSEISWSLLREILRISVPRALTLALGQISILALVGLASTMAVGSVSVFQFAYNLQSVPLAIVGASYSIAAFPYLADLFAQKKMEAFAGHIVSALRHIIFWSVPATGLLIVLRAQVVRTVLGSGAFSWSDTRLTAAVLALLSVSLVMQAVNLLLIRAFYAGGQTRIPFIVTLTGSLFVILCSVLFHEMYQHVTMLRLILESTLRIDGVAGTEVIGIGLCYSIAMCIQTAVLFGYAKVHFEIPTAWLWGSAIRSFIAALAGGFAAYITLNVFVEGINETAFLGIFIQGALGGVSGIIAIIAAYRLLGSPELAEVYTSLHTKIFKTQLVAPQEDVM